MGWGFGLAAETGCTRIGSPLKYEGNGNDNEVEGQSTYSFIVCNHLSRRQDSMTKSFVHEISKNNQ
jgi:hypothetical protein